MPAVLGPDFQKSYDSLRIFVQYTLILRQIYDITTIVNTLNIVNITKYINVNIKRHYLRHLTKSSASM